MGFGNIIAALVAVAGIMVASYIFVIGAFYTADTLTTSTRDIQNEKAGFLRTEIGIVDVVPDGVNIYVTLENTGHEKLRDYPSMDVFVRYYSPSGILELPGRLQYTESSPSDDEWTVAGISPDNINPGVLDPDEKLSIWIKVSRPVKTGSQNNWLQVTTPNGVSTSKYFDG
ncbi:hypothetical protein [Methanosarcina sp. 1.H.A.2.2]|uniref:hypothetical protein n=1 Tax=Methanosarcina sp. 1.H.A.2.2 TaxID=1483601 RepID=UPI00064FF61D|nr:hypothetical protein [Methanosarcina sp. 1.H.A.2.2]